MKKALRVLGAILSVFAFLFWLIMLFYAFLLGGSPGPGYERMVPFMYAGIMAFGWLGSVLAFVSGIVGSKRKAAGTALSVGAALLGILGSVPIFLLDLAFIGVIALLLGVLPPLLYLFLARESS